MRARSSLRAEGDVQMTRKPDRRVCPSTSSSRFVLVPLAMLSLTACLSLPTPITVHHKLVVEVLFSIWAEDEAGNRLDVDGPGRARAMTVQKGTTLASVRLMRLLDVATTLNSDHSVLSHPKSCVCPHVSTLHFCGSSRADKTPQMAPSQSMTLSPTWLENVLFAGSNPPTSYARPVRPPSHIRATTTLQNWWATMRVSVPCVRKKLYRAEPRIGMIALVG